MTATGQFVVEVGGTSLPSDVQGMLATATVEAGLALPDSFALRFRDAERVVLAKTSVKIGSGLRISAVPVGGQTAVLLLDGEVTALETEFDTHGTYTVVRGYDHAHRLFRGRRTESYTQVTASDVVTTVGRRAGLRLGQVDPTTTVFDHVTQGGTSDWQFLHGLAEEIGYELFVRDGRLEFRRPGGASGAPAAGPGSRTEPLVLALGVDLVRFRAVVTSAEQVKEVEVRGWDTAQKQQLVATAPAATSSSVLPSVTPADLAAVFGDQVLVATDVPHRTQSEVDGAAAALAEQVAGAYAQFEGLARGNPALRAGVAFSVDGLGSPFDGKYRITRSRHVWDPAGGYTTAVSVTGQTERSLLGLAGGRPPGRRMPGAVVALVSDVDDPERLGRVRLTCPWLSDSFVTDWARTVQVGAGKDRGSMVVSEVGDEVLVVFEQGDVRRPYVLGGLFNGVDGPPGGPVDLVDGTSGAVNRRSLVSRRGHRLDLLDQDGRTEGVQVTTGDGALRLVLDATGTALTVKSDGTVLVEGARGVVVDAGTAALDLKGGSVSISATSGVTVDGGAGAVSVSTGGELTLSGGPSCKVSALQVQIN